MTLRFGVVPSNGRECAPAAVAALYPQVDHLAVIEAGVNPNRIDYIDSITCLVDDSGEINISRWWNRGLDWAEGIATGLGETEWDVAIINDDVVVPSSWYCYIADDLRALGCVASCSGGTSHAPIIYREPGPVPLTLRLQGFAFVVAGESGIRAEENMRWYYSDDWLDWNARQLGGVVIFPGCHVDHRFPNMQVSHTMQIYNTEDAQKFKEAWGMTPW